MEVGVRVLVGARVAATDVPTRQAHPQMGPGTLAEFVAFLASARGEGFGFGGIGGGRQVFAGLGRGVQVALSRSPPHADQDRAVRDEEVSHVGPPLLAVLVMSVLLAGVARRYDVSAPLALVLAGLLAGLIPGLHGIELEPELVLFVILPPLLWSAGLESSYVNLRRNRRPIGLLAVGLPLATTFAVGVVAYHTVPELTVVAALTLGAIVAPPDAVSAAAIGRRLGLPRQIMTLLGGESLLNDATALTAY